MQPYLFPYLGYFQLMAASDRFVVLDDVNFINKGWINRNRLLVNGTDHTFTVPLRDASQNRLIKDIEIAEDGKWGAKLRKTIEMAYRKAPYFGPASEVINGVLDSNLSYISARINYSLELILQYLGVKVEIVPTSSVYQLTNEKGEDRILAICRLEKADHYINLIGGKELYSPQRFQQEGIRLSFLRSRLTSYHQGSADAFVPGLSIIDIMMFNSPEQIRNMLNDYETE